MRRSFAFSQTAACGGTRRRATFPSERAPPRSASAHDQWREVRVAFRVSHGGLVASKQISGRPDEAVDRPDRPLMPGDIERRKLRKELKAAVRQMVVNPISQRFPVSAVCIAIGEPWDHEACRRPAESSRVALVPDMAGVVLLIRRTVMAFR